MDEPAKTSLTSNIDECLKPVSSEKYMAEKKIILCQILHVT